MASPDWHLPLSLAAAAFALFMLWRARPVLSSSAPDHPSLKEAQGRVDAAATDRDRALALCDAGDVAAASVGRAGSAAAFYLRALRTDPSCVEVVERAVLTFSRRPRTLENLLWRRLALESWAKNGPAAERAVTELAKLYTHSRRSSVRGRALEGALELFGRRNVA